MKRDAAALHQTALWPKYARLSIGLIKYTVMTLFALMALFPFYWAFLSSMRTSAEILADPAGFPTSFSLNSYVSAWHSAKLGQYFQNTLFVSALAVIIIVLITSMAAYVMARVMKKNFWLYTILSLGLMIPAHTIIVPIFTLFHRAGLTNSLFGLILAYVAMEMSIGIFIMYGFMKGIPKEMEEAARIDGCNRLQTFVLVILPISVPAIATVAILAFLYCWNEFLLPLVLITKSESKMLSQGIQELNGQYVTDLAVMFAGVILASMPVVMIYLLFQKQVIKGMVSGAIKG